MDTTKCNTMVVPSKLHWVQSMDGNRALEVEEGVLDPPHKVVLTLTT